MYNPNNLPHPFYTDKWLESRTAAHQALLYIARHCAESDREAASKRAADFLVNYDRLIELARWSVPPDLPDPPR